MPTSFIPCAPAPTFIDRTGSLRYPEKNSPHSRGENGMWTSELVVSDDGLPAEPQARGGSEVVAGEIARIQATIHL